MITIRPATGDDMEAVAQLELDVFGFTAWSWDSVEVEFEAVGQSRYIVVAEDDDRLVGYASLMYVAGLADLQRIAVRERHRRQGLASDLLWSVLDATVHHGCHKILLEVAADNEPALAFYTAHGFHEISKRKRYYAGMVDAVVMEKNMPDPADPRAEVP